MPTELDQFMQDIESDPNETADILNQSLLPEEPQAPEVEIEEDDNDDENDFKPKNRRERRLLRKLEQERESAIFLAGKLEAQQESKQSTGEEAAYLKNIERIYGTNSPEAIEATELLKQAFVGLREEAEQSAIQKFRAQQENESNAVAAAEEELDNIIDDLQDRYDVDLTKAQQRSYYTLLQRMSPKDAEGNVTSLADPDAVWEIFQEKMAAKPANPAKALSSRSMVQNGTSTESNLQDDSALRYLRDSGII